MDLRSMAGMWLSLLERSRDVYFPCSHNRVFLAPVLSEESLSSYT